MLEEDIATIVIDERALLYDIEPGVSELYHLPSDLDHTTVQVSNR
jgi:hypothetical protein